VRRADDERNVLAITQNFSTRIVAKGLLCVTVATLVLLGTPILGGSASAAAPVAEQTPEVTPSAEPVAEPAPEVTPSAEPAAEPAPETTPSAEPVAEPAPETTPSAEPVAEPAPETTPPAEPIEVQAEEVAPTVPTTEPVAQGLPSSPAAPQDSAPPDDSSDPAAAEASNDPIGPLTMDPVAADPGEPPATLATGPTSTNAPLRLTAARRAGALSWKFSGLAGPVTDNCSAGWLGAQSLLSASTVDFATGETARRSVRASGGSDGSEGGGRSVSPPPGSAPSGAFGGSAAGGSGIAFSDFSTLAGVLHLAAPRAMRRLRLSCQPWTTAFFVLIPERPG
jgi:outer membrane biosynthesis protein TonB